MRARVFVWDPETVAYQKSFKSWAHETENFPGDVI